MSDDQSKTESGNAPEVLPGVGQAPEIAVPEDGVGVLSPVGENVLDDHHADFVEFHEGYLRNYISLADTKAAWVFTIASGMLIYLFSLDFTISDLIHPSRSFSYLILVVPILLLAVSAFFAFLVIAPRLKSPSGESIVFFGAVARTPNADRYISAVAACDRRALTEARLRHSYDVSRVCNRKYASLKFAIWLGLPGLALALAYIVLR